MPQLALLYIVFFGATRVLGINLTAEFSAIIVFTFWGTGETGDLVRGALASTSRHQYESVAIARALAMEPEILLLDEVTAALDPEMVREVLDVILDLAREGKTMVIVTHEMQFARAVADRVLFFDGGGIVEQDIPERFFAHPQTERAQRFLHTFEFDAVRKHNA